MTSQIARRRQSKTKCADAQFTDFAREKSNRSHIPMNFAEIKKAVAAIALPS
jgi:hypothetical protein